MGDLDTLRELMEADRWIERVATSRDHLPEIAELQRLETDMRALAVRLRDAQAALAPVRADLEGAQRETSRLRARAEELGDTLAASTASARDLTAIQHELENVRGVLSRAEDHELDLLMAIEPLEGAEADLRATAQPAVARREELRALIGELRAGLDEELVDLAARRAQVAARLGPPLAARYEAALRRAGTSGAAQVDAGRCDGCRLALSPLDVDRWRHVPEGEVVDCPECGRLLLP